MPSVFRRSATVLMAWMQIVNGARRSYTAPMGGMDAWGLRAAALVLAGIAGAALQLQQPALWSAAAYLAILALGATAFVLAGLSERARGFSLLLALAAAMFAATGLRAGHRLADALPAALEGQDIVVTGVVAELPRQMPDGVRFTFEVEAATHGDRPAQVPRRISLGWYRGW